MVEVMFIDTKVRDGCRQPRVWGARWAGWHRVSFALGFNGILQLTLILQLPLATSSRGKGILQALGLGRLLLRMMKPTRRWHD
jgi:hypothetical protein